MELGLGVRRAKSINKKKKKKIETLNKHSFNKQIKYNLKLLCYYMINNLQSLNTIDKYYAHKHSTTNQ